MKKKQQRSKNVDASSDVVHFNIKRGIRTKVNWKETHAKTALQYPKSLKTLVDNFGRIDLSYLVDTRL